MGFEATVVGMTIVVYQIVDVNHENASIEDLAVIQSLIRHGVLTPVCPLHWHLRLIETSGRMT
jgi:hypothetical protein